MSDEDRYYLGSQEIPLAEERPKADFLQRLRQYLDVRNVAFLIGNGASIPLGAPTIGDVRSLIPELTKAQYALADEAERADALAVLNTLLPDGSPKLGVEPLLGTVYHLQGDLETLPKNTTIQINGTSITKKSLHHLERALKKWLFTRCHDLSVTTPMDKLADHCELFRRLLLRSPTLPRIKLFTTNYDLLIERALDDLGIAYFDGFVGTVRRSLRNESYRYDLYFPGDTTEGKVRRVDRVLHLYKVHGSLNWRRNADGYRLDVVIDHGVPEEEEFGEVMVYPSPFKLTEMHGYPYSEMFRYLSAQINQPQSVLFTVGYSFADDHINRIIYQALSIPSFSLVIVLPTFPVPADPMKPGSEHEVWRLINKVNSKRILVLTGGAGTMRDFANAWMPDIREMDITAKVKEEADHAIAPPTATE
jgi:hypothetical protein